MKKVFAILVVLGVVSSAGLITEGAQAMPCRYINSAHGPLC